MDHSSETLQYPSKPHLTRSAGGWRCQAGRVCYGFSRYAGWGKTPKQAYESREAKIDWDRRFGDHSR